METNSQFFFCLPQLQMHQSLLLPSTSLREPLPADIIPSIDKTIAMDQTSSLHYTGPRESLPANIVASIDGAIADRSDPPKWSSITLDQLLSLHSIGIQAPRHAYIRDPTDSDDRDLQQSPPRAYSDLDIEENQGQFSLRRDIWVQLCYHGFVFTFVVMTLGAIGVGIWGGVVRLKGEF